jgi:TonB family protein
VHRSVGVLLLLLSFCVSWPAWAHEPGTLPPADGPPRLKTFVEPAYPAEDRLHGIGGTVTLRLHIDAGGRVTAASVEHGIEPSIDQAALSAGRKLTFDPARQGGLAVPSVISFEYRFTPPGHTHALPVVTDQAAVERVSSDQVDTVSVVQSVDEERPLTAASARSVRQRDLARRPVNRPSDLLRVTPGLLVVQHAGGGKANQYLLRGVDADHGTDVAISYDGVPVNMVSHGHGQGFADTNFIIPELVERVDVAKGTYFVDKGDFATAGAVDLYSRDRGPSFVALQGGSFDTVRAVGIASPELGNAWHPLLAAEVMHTDGPFQNPERFAKYNLHCGLDYDAGEHSRIALSASAYHGTWNASGQLPGRAVAQGLVGFFGALDPSEGGESGRESVSVRYTLRPDPYRELQALAYLTFYDFDLYSNFTFFSRDPVDGDEIEQRDHRVVRGARASYRWMRQWRGVLFDSTLGGEARADSIANGLDHVRQRERLARVTDDAIEESALAVYARQEVQPLRWLRLVGGLRLDHYAFRVDDHLEDLATTGTATSGSRGAGRVSPKATVVLSPHRTTDVFLNFGYGFHSNDARGVIRSADAVTPLTRAIGYELGTRTHLADRRLELALALWGLDLDSETVWVGDEGTTESAGATRRLGLELEGRWEILPWLFADADLTASRARFRQNDGNGQAVALAPRLMFSGGLAALHPNGMRGGLRALYVAARPATPDGFLEAEGALLFDAFAAYRWRAFELSLTLENLTDRRYKSAQFATVTRLAGEAPTSAPPPPGACPPGTRAAADGKTGNFRGCQDLSFSPGNPFSLRLGATCYF